VNHRVARIHGAPHMTRFSNLVEFSVALIYARSTPAKRGSLFLAQINCTIVKFCSILTNYSTSTTFTYLSRVEKDSTNFYSIVSAFA